MKQHLKSMIALVLALAPIASLCASGTEDAPEKTLSPYFYVKGGEISTDAMPLKSTSVDVKIAGVIADVRVTQTYSNAGTTPLEAVYIFPASTRAAVHGLQMTIGDRVLKAVVQKRDEARSTYEKAKSEGRSASLLEQQRPNVFQMNVAQILPGDTIHGGAALYRTARTDSRRVSVRLPDGGGAALLESAGDDRASDRSVGGESLSRERRKVAVHL
jgi:Ca-activated chloride channel family protein